MIQIKNASTQPSLVFDKIFLQTFVCTQDQTTGLKSVRAEIKIYADAAGGTKVFADGVHTFTNPDFDEWAFTHVAGLLGSTEQATASYSAATTAANSLNLLECMAAFQAGIGRIFELSGAFEVEAVS